MNKGIIPELKNQLERARRILLVSHIRPDGDAIGSLVGCGLALQTAEKEVQMVVADGIPNALRFLPGTDQVINRPTGEFDLIWVLDCSDLNRTGGVLDGRLPPDINIDHHVTNLHFARMNLVDLEAVATAEIIARLLPELGIPILEASAQALLTGILTDTLGFRTSNMTPQVLRLAADLVEKGGNLPELYQLSLLNRSFEAARYWGCGLSQLQREGRMIWTILTLADRRAVRYPGNDDADLINILSSIQDTDIAMIFVEQPGGKIKVSWRAHHGLDVSGLATQFAGGGHAAAAGAEIGGKLEDILKEVLVATRKLIEEKHNTVEIY